MKTEFSKQIKKLDIKNLVKATFPYSKDFEVKLSVYAEKGIAKWPTWFIVIYRGKILDDFILLTICEHSAYTKSDFFKVDFDVTEFEKDLQKAISGNDLLQFIYKNDYTGDNHLLEINEMKRLYDFLFENGIILFEPTL